MNGLLHPPRAHHLPSNAELHRSIEKEIAEVKQRILHSNQILQTVHRQIGSPRKVVPSDAFNILFHHAQPKQITIDSDIGFDEDDLETQREGRAQLAAQMTPLSHNGFASELKNKRERVFTDAIDDLEHSLSRDKETKDHLHSLSHSLQARDHYATERVGQKSTRERNLPGAKHKRNETHRQRDASAEKDNSQNYMTERKNLRLEDYYTQAENILHSSKEKQKPHKITIKLNRPNTGKNSGKPNNNSLKQFTMKPRYQIEVPDIITAPSTKKAQLQHNQSMTWEDLQTKVHKYDFVRKYLSTSDLYSIYDHLRRNGIACERWPLFVVDQAYAKMNQPKRK